MECLSLLTQCADQFLALGAHVRFSDCKVMTFLAKGLATNVASHALTVVRDKAGMEWGLVGQRHRK